MVLWKSEATLSKLQNNLKAQALKNTITASFLYPLWIYSLKQPIAYLNAESNNEQAVSTHLTRCIQPLPPKVIY